jgi:hypothetical protein
MLRARLSTKLLLSMLLVSAALTISSLFFVRRFMQAQVRREIQSDLRNSELTFQNLQRQRETALSRSAQLMADLPTLRALMPATDPRTIQDASQGVWKLGGSDLFVLVDRAGRVVALHRNFSIRHCNRKPPITGGLGEDTCTRCSFNPSILGRQRTIA